MMTVNSRKISIRWGTFRFFVNMIPKGPLNKMLPLTSRGGGGGGGDIYLHVLV